MILVTGGTGLLGSHLLYFLTLEGHNIKAVRRSTSSISSVENLFRSYSEDADQLLNKIEWVSTDICDILGMEEAFDGIDKVFHCAAIVSFNPSKRKEMMRVNVDGTANIVDLCLKKGISKLVYVSSIAALGRAKSGTEITEETKWQPSGNNSYYAISKYSAEREVWRGIAEGLNAVIINPAVILGPGDWNNGPQKMFKLVWKGLKFHSTGINGFVDVRDVVQVMIQLMESEVSSERFIVSSENLSYKEVLHTIADALQKKRTSITSGKFLSGIGWRVLKITSLFSNKDSIVTKETARTANQIYHYNNAKIKSALSFQFLPIKKSIDETAKFFLKQQEA